MAETPRAGKLEARATLPRRSEPQLRGRPRRRPRPVRRAGLPAAFAVIALALGIGPSSLALGPALLSADETPVLTHADLTVYQEAFELSKDGKHDDALAKAAGAGDRTLVKVLEWNRVRGNSDATFTEILAFLEAHPVWPSQRLLQVRAELAMPWDTADDVVLAFFADRTPETASGVIHLGEALFNAGRTEEGLSLVRQSWVEMNFSKTEARSFRRHFSQHLRDSDEVARLDRLLWDRRTREAQRMLGLVSQGRQRLAQARIALIRMAGGVDRAIERVPDALQDDPGLAFDRANWRMRKGRYEDTYELVRQVGADVPFAERWWPIRNWVAREAFERGSYRRAYQVTSRNGLDPGGADFAEAAWFSGWLALRYLDDPKAAAGHFEALYEAVTTPISLGRGAYWAGRAQEALGNPEAAIEWFTTAAAQVTTFYGQLAAERLGLYDTYLDPREPWPPLVNRVVFEEQEIPMIVRRLAAMDRLDDALPFIYAMMDAAVSYEDYWMVARLAVDLGRQDVALAVAKRARYDGHLLLEFLYPVHPVARTARPDPALVHSVIRQESAFNPHAVSHVGATGLMQLMPSTAKAVARANKIRFTKDRLTQPIYNLRLGKAYLTEVLDTFDGSYVLALAAYNAGPGRARMWIDMFGDPRDPNVDAVDWIESITFSETRNYVQRVLESVAIYRHRLAPETVAYSLADDLKR